jgi:hypothetical protein
MHNELIGEAIFELGAASFFGIAENLQGRPPPEIFTKS